MVRIGTSIHQQRVEEFMRKAGQAVPDSPTIPPRSVRLLRAHLILEEALETVRALGFVASVVINTTPDGDKQHDVTVFPDGEPDLMRSPTAAPTSRS